MFKSLITSSLSNSSILLIIYNGLRLESIKSLIVNLFLTIKDFEKETSFFEIESFFSDYYQNQQFIKVKSNNDIELPDGFYKPNLILNSNDVEINIFKNTNSGQLIISTNFDNLGKGASAAAIQCMNLRFGFDEILGL